MAEHHHHHDHEEQECCSHEHHHHHDHHGSKGQISIIVATILLLLLAVFIEKHVELPTWQLLMIYLIPYLLIGHRTLWEATAGVGTWRCLQ